MMKSMMFVIAAIVSVSGVAHAATTTKAAARATPARTGGIHAPIQPVASVKKGAHPRIGKPAPMVRRKPYS